MGVLYCMSGFAVLTVFIAALVQGKGIWIRYNRMTIGPNYGRRKMPSVNFSGMESALRGTKMKAECNKIQSLKKAR